MKDRKQRASEKPLPFLAPALFLLSAVTIYPLLYLIYLSLRRKLLIFHVSRFVGMDNYLQLAADARFWNACKNTIYFTVLSVSLELLVGLAIALLLARPFRWSGSIRASLLLPWAIPTVVSARMWQWIYNPDVSVLNYLLGTQINWLGSPFWAMNAAILMDVWKTVPFVAILLIAGLQVIPRQFYQAAALDGAGAWSTFRYVTLPLLKPVISVALIFRFLDAFRVFDSIYVLTGGGPANTTETLSIYASKVLFQTLQVGYGSTIALVVFLLMALVSLFYVTIAAGETK